MNGLDEAYGSIIEPGTIQFARLLPGPIERVWAYLTESDKRGQWLASGTMEPRAGGAVDLFFHHGSLSKAQAPIPERFKSMEAGFTSQHRVIRFEPPRFLSFTWSDGTDGPSEVSFELTPEGDKVRLMLTHRKLRDRAAMLGTAGGWHVHLIVLRYRLNDEEPPAFWTIFNSVERAYETQFPKDSPQAART